jgi:hypothetical protein
VSGDTPKIDGDAGRQPAEVIAGREQRRQNDKLRKRKERRNWTPAQRDADRDRKRKERSNWTPTQRESERKRNRSRSRFPPFMAIDGEGAGTDALGRQPYLLMAASGPAPGDERILHHEGQPLSVKDSLEFILSLPRNRTLVAFFFGYDTNQILRGINPQKWMAFFKPSQGKHGPRYTFWGDYAILYQKGQFLRVARVDRSGPKPCVVKGSSRTINEVFGFFQCAFAKAIDDWEIGDKAERASIAATKGLRAEFKELTTEIVDYCVLECRYLAMLMNEFRDMCSTAGIVPRHWRGAGWLATALLEKRRVPKRPLTTREKAEETEAKSAKNAYPRRPLRDADLELAANYAYYGGRFEVSRIGLIPGPVYQYDLRSAYPAAMRSLPCPMHTRWTHRPIVRHLPTNKLYLARVVFEHPDGPWCGLPFRRNGGLFWPFQGTGWYWSPEIEAAQRSLGAKIRPLEAWIADQRCDCALYNWVEDVYAQRQLLGSKTRGYPLKIGLAALYGKLAQHTGHAPFHDAVDSGLITAITRAQLVEAMGHDPDAVVMQATDALFSTRLLPLAVGEGLGQWEMKEWPDLFVVQPGVYWSPTEEEQRAQAPSPDAAKSTVKSRGAPRSAIEPATLRFHAAFETFLSHLASEEQRPLVLRERLIPSVPVPVRVFHGCRLADQRHDPTLAGQWKDVERRLSFEWMTKRDPMRIEVNASNIATYPIMLPSRLMESEGYTPVDFDSRFTVSDESGVASEVDEGTLAEAMPDYQPFVPHE